MNQSYWQKTTRKTNDKKIDKDIECDVLIIGGGLTGVALAYYLKDTDFKVAVVDKDEIGSHTSGHTTAKITVLHDVLYYKIKKYYDIHYAYLYYQSNLKALSDIKDIINKEKIECDYKENQSYIYATTPKMIQMIQEQKNIFHSIKVQYSEDSHFASSMGLENQAVFHPLKYLFALKKICEKGNIEFYERSLVTKVEKKENMILSYVNDQTIRSKYVIHASRYPFFKNHFYYMKLFQQREFVDYNENQQSDDSYLCLDEVSSYRPISDNASLNICKDSSQWYAMDSVPIRGIPYIGRLKSDSNEFIAFGYQKWGMTLSHVAARLIRDLIMDKENAYENLYAPNYFSLSFLKEYKNDLIQHLKKGYLTNRKDTKELDELKKGEGSLVKHEGNLYAVYRDKKGEYYFMSPYCRHLKCVIAFDHLSNTWICPCHQSIYDAYGKVLEGPSLYDLKKKKGLILR